MNDGKIKQRSFGAQVKKYFPWTLHSGGKFEGIGSLIIFYRVTCK
jgi:hypothetical protein